MQDTILAIREEMAKIEQELAQGDIPYSDQAGLEQLWDSLDAEVFRLEMMAENEIREPAQPAVDEGTETWLSDDVGDDTEALTMDQVEKMRLDKEDAHAYAWQCEDWYYD